MDLAKNICDFSSVSPHYHKTQSLKKLCESGLLRSNDLNEVIAFVWTTAQWTDVRILLVDYYISLNFTPFPQNDEIFY